MVWTPLPLDADVMQNVSETSLRYNYATLENGYINDVGGHTRFPGLKKVLQLNPGRVYLHESELLGDMIAVSNGQMWRIGQDLKPTNVTNVPVSGGQRVIFAETEEQLLVAAGGPIVSYGAGAAKTALLSPNAPLTTHVAYVAGYVVALEAGSQRFKYSNPGDYTNWDPLNVLSAEFKADVLVALEVTPREELILAGPDSVEQHVPFANGNQPFYREWGCPDGLLAPYTLICTKEGNFGVNENSEFVSFVGYETQQASADIQLTLSAITDWTDAWAHDVRVAGQKFVMLQAPNAVTPYGTKGMTMLLNLKNLKWSFLYGWDQSASLPTRWPGWDHQRIWGQNYIGGDDGWIYQLDVNTFDNGGGVQRMIGRTGHLGTGNAKYEINGFRIRLRRGAVDPNTSPPPKIQLRFNKDNLGFGRWIERDLGLWGQSDMVILVGPLGNAYTLQAEYVVTDRAPVDIVAVEADIVELPT